MAWCEFLLCCVLNFAVIAHQHCESSSLPRERAAAQAGRAVVSLQSKQLMGLRGLFSKAPKAGAAEPGGHHARKRSIGERILRRTASAPAKGRKKSKMGFLEAAEMKDSASEPADLKDKEGVLRRPRRPSQARPASMPVDRFLMVELPCPAQDTAQEAEGEDNASGKVLPKLLLVNGQGSPRFFQSI